MATTCAAYYPSQADAQSFWNGALVQERVSNHEADHLPNRFPRAINSSLAWKGSEIQSKESEWKVELGIQEVAAIEAALKDFEAQDRDLSSISAETFRLPSSFSQRLRKLSDQLYKGVGFQIIRGLDPSKYTDRQKLIVYAGVTSHIYPQRGFTNVDYKGVVAHVLNVQGVPGGPKTTAPAFGNIPLSFHTDNCEIMAFYFFDTAVTGGRTVLSSSWQTYNELAANRADVIRTLAEPWVMDTFKPYELQPPRHVHCLHALDSDKIPILFRFSRYPVVGWQRERTSGLSEPTEAQLQAADAVQFTAMKNAITLPVDKGDMLLVNDMALFHAREGFDDGDTPMKRHLVKMYFRDPEQGWGVPPPVGTEWSDPYVTNMPDGERIETWDVVYAPGLQEMAILNG